MVHFADLTFNVQPSSPLRYSDTFMNLIPMMIYRGMWLGCDLIFHRESAEALEALKCGGDRDGVVGCGVRGTCTGFFPPLSDPGTVVCGLGLSLVPFSDGVLSAPARSESLRAILISTGRGE